MTQIHERESKRGWKGEMYLVAYGCFALFFLGMGAGDLKKRNTGYTIVFGKTREVSASCQAQKGYQEEL